MQIGRDVAGIVHVEESVQPLEKIWQRDIPFHAEILPRLLVEARDSKIRIEKDDAVLHRLEHVVKLGLFIEKRAMEAQAERDLHLG